jgi:hypothetical protein
MKRIIILSVLVVSSAALAVGAVVFFLPTSTDWPSLESQLARDHVHPGTALDAFIRANQNFSILDPREAHDNVPLPLWLRVAFRKDNPEFRGYSGDDSSTGGYPDFLIRNAPWMLTHQDLRPGKQEPDVLPNGQVLPSAPD